MKKDLSQQGFIHSSNDIYTTDKGKTFEIYPKAVSLLYVMNTHASYKEKIYYVYLLTLIF